MSKHSNYGQVAQYKNDYGTLTVNIYRQTGGKKHGNKGISACRYKSSGGEAGVLSEDDCFTGRIRTGDPASDE